MDKKLALAWQILQNETDPNTGVPVWLAFSDNKHLGFKIKKRMNYALKEQASWSKKHEKDLKDGEIFNVEPYMPKGMTLPTRREYYDSLEED